MYVCFVTSTPVVCRHHHHHHRRIYITKLFYIVRPFAVIIIIIIIIIPRQTSLLLALYTYICIIGYNGVRILELHSSAVTAIIIRQIYDLGSENVVVARYNASYILSTTINYKPLHIILSRIICKCI